MPPGYTFTDDSAWEFIASNLESGRTYEMVTLDFPAGAPAIVMLIPLPSEAKPLYVKVEIGVACKAIGRSFHLTYL